VWVVLSEIFPNRVRGRAMSIATVSLWVACFALTMTFLSLAKAITPTGAFWLYAAMCVVTFWIVWRYTPETSPTFALGGHFLSSRQKIPFAFNVGTAEIGENRLGEDLASFLRRPSLACCC